MSDHPVTIPSAAPARAAAADRGFGLLRTHLLEVVLFAASLALLGATIGVTAHVALSTTTQSQDLTFASTLDELALVLSNGGADQLATLQRASLPSGNGPIVVDTIAILASPKDEPAAAPGGFIADQVALFNDHAIRQAQVQAALGASATNGVTDAPSLLRTVRTENGERRISERPNPFLMAVRSPYAERTWREVRTADWSSSGGLLGLAGDIALAPDMRDGARSSLNGRDCTIRRPSEQFLLYCGSALASDVGRFYDLGLVPDAGGFPAQASLYRSGTLWRNGEAQQFERGPVQSGDVLHTERTGPVMLSTAHRGTLAAGQWINGRNSFSNQRLGTISFFAAAGRSSSGGSTAPVVLSLDATLSRDLEHAAEGFLTAQPLLRRMSVVLLNARTGEVLAIAEPARRSDAEPLIAFEPLLVGSVVKPLVAAAIVARRPNLAQLRVRYAGDTVRVVAGVPLQRGFANAGNGCYGDIGFSEFIRCSSNQYAAELLVQSLRADGFRGTTGEVLVPRDLLETSAIGAGLAEAFDVDAWAGRTAGRRGGLWSAMQNAPADRMLLPWESRPWLVFPDTDGTRLDLLARYAFGGWENRWTLIGLGEAYARIATGRETATRIVSDTTTAAYLPANVRTAFGRVRSALREVSVDGTAGGLAPDLRNSLGGDVDVLAKTGTLNEDTDRFKSLALVIGKAANGGTAQELGCGVVAITYFDFHEAPRNRRREPLPAVHLDFARGAFASVLQRHWQRVSGCAESSQR